MNKENEENKDQEPKKESQQPQEEKPAQEPAETPAPVDQPQKVEKQDQEKDKTADVQAPSTEEKPAEPQATESKSEAPAAEGQAENQSKAETGEAPKKQAPAEKPRAGRIPEQKDTNKKKEKGHTARRDPQPKTGEEEVEFIEKVIAINRITKVTKGGKKLSFSALVVVGDTKGNVGYSLSKAAEVSIAIRKAMGIAKKTMVRIPLHGTTIPHEIIGQCSGSRVLLKPASDGTGVIASGPVRAVCDGAGIHNILTKCHRSNNPINVVKATMDGLTRLKPMPEDLAEIKEEVAVDTQEAKEE